MCVAATGPQPWLLLQVCVVLSPHPRSPATGHHSHHILQNVNPRKKLQSSFCPQSCFPVHSVRDACWGPKQDTKPQRLSRNNISHINFSPVLHCQSFQFCSPGGKIRLKRSLGLRFGSRQLCLVLSIQPWLSEQSQNGCF